MLAVQERASAEAVFRTSVLLTLMAALQAACYSACVSMVADDIWHEAAQACRTAFGGAAMQEA